MWELPVFDMNIEHPHIESQDEEWERRPTLPPFELNGFVLGRDIGGIIISFVCKTWRPVERTDVKHLGSITNWNSWIDHFARFHEFHLLSVSLVCKTWKSLIPVLPTKRTRRLCNEKKNSYFL